MLNRPRLPLEDTTLSNGFRVLVQPDHRLPLVVAQMTFPRGSGCDPAGRSGVAHLSEHFAYHGPERLKESDLSGRIRSFGGIAAASTSRDATYFRATGPSARWRDLIALERNRLGPYCIEQRELHNQQRILSRERHQTLENVPYGSDFEDLYRMVFPHGHPYHRSVAGDPGEIPGIAPSDISRFLESYCVEGATLALVGDLVPEEVFREAEERFANVVLSSQSSVAGSQPIGLGNEAKVSRSRGRVPALRSYLAFPGPPAGRLDSYALNLFLGGVGLGRACRLKRVLIQDRRVATEARVHFEPSRLGSLIVFSATGARGVGAEELEEALRDAVATLRRDELLTEERERSRAKALTDFYSLAQRWDHRAGLIAQQAFHSRSGDRWVWESEGLLAVASQQPNLAARKFLIPERATCLSRIPEA